MSENLDEKKIEIKSSLLISIIVFAVFLLITVVFLIGFLVGSDRKKENIHTTTVITQKEDNIKQNKKDENFSTQKEEDKDEALKRLGFIPHGSKKEDSNSSSKSDESKDTRNLSALFSSVNEQDSNGFQSNITSNATTSNQITSSSTYTNSSSQNYNISSDSGREAVKNYFMELELKLAGSKTWNDPNQFAEQLLKSAMSGDFSDLNDLTNNMKRVADDVARMRVPAECAEHRDAVVSSLNDSINILNKVKRGISEGNMDIIMSLTSEADKIKASAGKSDELMKQLKLKYNI